MEMYTLRDYAMVIMYLHVSLHRKNKPRARLSQGHIASYKKAASRNTDRDPSNIRAS